MEENDLLHVCFLVDKSGSLSIYESLVRAKEESGYTVDLENYYGFEDSNYTGLEYFIGDLSGHTDIMFTYARNESDNLIIDVPYRKIGDVDIRFESNSPIKNDCTRLFDLIEYVLSELPNYYKINTPTKAIFVIVSDIGGMHLGLSHDVSSIDERIKSVIDGFINEFPSIDISFIYFGLDERSNNFSIDTFGCENGCFTKRIDVDKSYRGFADAISVFPSAIDENIDENFKNITFRYALDNNLDYNEFSYA